MAKLTAPCPHCGSPTQSYSIYGFWGVRCEAGCNSLHPSREKAVDAWNDQASNAEAQIADLKRALDTARNDAMEEAAKVADDEEGAIWADWGMHSNMKVAQTTCIAIAAAIRRLSASPLSQGGQT